MLASFRIVVALLRRDLFILKKDFLNNLIDIFVWPTVASIVFGYIVPSITKSSPSYGSFVLMGSIVTISIVMAFDEATQRITDLETKRTIDFHLTLPVDPAYIFIKQALFIAIKNILFTLPIFPWGKLILYDRFDISHFSLSKFVLIYLLINLFIGFFAIWLTSWVKTQAVFIRVWLRLYNPMNWFGGQIFSWHQLTSVIPWLGYLMLCNPITFCNEGLRAAIFGNENLISFWLSACMLVAFTILFGFLSIYGLKKRLQCP